jgi:hypothetical protein
VGNILELVGDYTNPILQPWAAEVVKRFGEISLAGVGFPSPRNQCWPGGVPFVFTSGAIEILQQQDQVAILYNYDHQVRHVRLNQSHLAHVMPTWYGDSVGHYEGDTLVIDTVAVKIGPFATVDWYGTPHTEALHVVERYRVIATMEPHKADGTGTQKRISASSHGQAIATASTCSSSSRSRTKAFSRPRGPRP